MFGQDKNVSSRSVAQNLIPRWMRHIQDFESLEIKTSQFTGGASNSKDAVGPSEAKEGYFWTVYGRYKPNHRKSGLEVLGDFEIESEALQFHDKLIEAFPHLAGEQKPATIQPSQKKPSPQNI